MVTTRIGVAVVGTLVGAYGAWLLLGEGLDQVWAAAVWLVAGVVLHDFVLVPVALAVGYVVVRLLPASWRAVAVGAAVVLATVTVAAVPVLSGEGRRTDNPTLLPRDYVAGWFAFAVAVLLVATAVALTRRQRSRSTATRVDDDEDSA